MKKYSILNLCICCEHGWRQRHEGCDREEALYADQLIPERLLEDKNQSTAIIACKNFKESYE